MNQVSHVKLLGVNLRAQQRFIDKLLDANSLSYLAYIFLEIRNIKFRKRLRIEICIIKANRLSSDYSEVVFRKRVEDSTYKSLA